MLPSLQAEHKKQLLFLAEQSSQVLQDFCKLAVDYLHKGPNLKLYSAAAQRLQVEPEVIRGTVEGLINLLLECAKERDSEETFRRLIKSLGFNDEKEMLLVKFYDIEKNEINGALTKIGLQLPRYHDAEWRFQVQLASRALNKQLTPHFTIDLMLKNETDSTSVIEHRLLQCDTTNLLRLTQELELAIGEGKTQHMRSIKRNIK